MLTRLTPAQYGRLHEKSDTVEIRFMNQAGNTEVWTVGEAMASEILERARRSRAVLAGHLDRGIDTRIGVQRAAIERLQRHVEFHHEKHMGLAMVFGCGYTEEEKA